MGHIGRRSRRDTMSGPEDWYLSAEARWKHLPPGDERERRVRQTFVEIRDEAEAVAVRLPELTLEEQVDLCNEAFLDAIARLGMPSDDVSEELIQHHRDLLFHLLCLRAREAKADPRVRSKLLERRLFRMPGIRRYLGLAPE